MGLTSVLVTIKSLDEKKKVSGEFLVDTGASFTVVPEEMAKKLSLKKDRVQRFSLADGSVMKRSLGFALVELDGQKSPSPVVIGEKGDSPLLGALTLEGMGLLVDPFSRKLRPMKLMLG